MGEMEDGGVKVWKRPQLRRVWLLGRMVQTQKRYTEFAEDGQASSLK